MQRKAKIQRPLPAVKISLTIREINHLIEAMYPYIDTRFDIQRRTEASRLKNKLLNIIIAKGRKCKDNLKTAPTV